MLKKIVSSSRKNLGAVILLISVAILSKLFGFVRNAVLAYLFGTSSIADEYSLLLYPTELILSFVVNNTIITALVSLFGKEIEDKTKELFWRILHFYQIVLTAVTLVIVIIMAVLYSQLSLPLLILSGLSAILYGVSGIIQSYLHFKQKFYRASLQDLLSQIVLTIGIGVSSLYGMWWFGFALILSGIVRIMLLTPDLSRIIGKLSVMQFLPTKVENRKELLIGIFPLLLSFFLSNIPSFFLIFFFERGGDGLVAAYNYAIKITAMFNPIIIIPLTTYAIPKLLQLDKEKKYQDSQLYSLIIVALAFIGGIIFSIFVWLFAEFITNILYARGSFDTSAVLLTTEMLKWYILPVTGYAVMYFLLQRVVLVGQNRIVLISYALGTLVTIAGLFFPTPLIPRGAIALTVGTMTSIIVLIYGVLTTRKNLS
jgi:putative peptidoglycan lipid II flippase